MASRAKFGLANVGESGESATSTRNAPKMCLRVLARVPATFAKFALAKFAVEWPLFNKFT